MNNNFAILILSCDRYADLWHVALKQFTTHFQQCPFKIYLGSNTIICNYTGVISLLSGEDKDWSSSYLAILKQIPEKKLFVLLEDLLVVSPIDRSRFTACVQFIEDHNANHIKYWPNPRPDRSSDYPEFEIYDRGAPYRATVCGFWDRDCLQKILIPGENPWNFEVLGSYRTSYMDGFFSLTTPLFSVINMVEKGCWIHKSVTVARGMGIEIDLTKRRESAGVRSLKSQLQEFFCNLMLKVPWRYRVSALALLRKFFISY
jgi:hypothetical protein